MGDCNNWVAIDRPTNMVLAFVCGKRTGEDAMELARKVLRVTYPDVRFQLTTDGLQSYIAAVDEMPRDRCDFAQVVKVYAAPCEGEHRRSPAGCAGADPVV